jgi:hypothetical protein
MLKPKGSRSIELRNGETGSARVSRLKSLNEPFLSQESELKLTGIVATLVMSLLLRRIALCRLVYKPLGVATNIGSHPDHDQTPSSQDSIVI